LFCLEHGISPDGQLAPDKKAAPKAEDKDKKA